MEIDFGEQGQTQGLEVLRYPAAGHVALAGRLGTRCAGNRRYLADLYEQRKDWMLEPFQRRGQDPVVEPVRARKQEASWAGEYAGKWLDAAALAAAGWRDPQLNEYVAAFAAALIAAQDADGYLGIEAPDQRGASEWDTWNIKYALTGLLTQAEVTLEPTALSIAEQGGWWQVGRDPAALAAALRGGWWLVQHHGPVNAPGHPFLSGPYQGAVAVTVIDQVVRLAAASGDARLLEFVDSVVASFPLIAPMRATGQAPLIHAYTLAADLGGVAALASAEQDPAALAWVEVVWDDIVARHLYPTGSLGFGEALRDGAPNDTPVDAGRPNRHHQETCATVEWLMLCATLHQLTGRVRYAQAMEQTIYNALLAAQSRDGQRWLYFLPLRYEKRWFAGPTSCCYWSGPRGLARLPQWVYALDSDGLRVNLYASSLATLPVAGGQVIVAQESSYPERGEVRLRLTPHVDVAQPFSLRLRVPFDAAQTVLRLNGDSLRDVPVVDGYFVITRAWAAGDTLELDFDVPVTVRRFVSDDYGVVVRGPEVLAVDERDNAGLDLDQLALPPALALTSLLPLGSRPRYEGAVLVNGQPARVVFTPYAECGDQGSRFRTAFPVARG